MANSAKSGGVGCLTVIGIVLVMMKLLEVGKVANWSWWWVTCPFWGPIALVFAAVFVIILFGRGR